MVRRMFPLFTVKVKDNQCKASSMVPSDEDLFKANWGLEFHTTDD